MGDDMREHKNRELWYTAPAVYWEEALPLGNGRLGAMLYGGITEDVIHLNEDTFWSGYPKKHDFPDAPAHYRIARDLALEGKYEEAQQEVEDYLTGECTDCYLPLGDIRLEFPELKEKEVKDYERYLHLKEAVTGSGFCCNGTAYRKEAFISWPEQAMYMKMTAEEAEKLAFRVSLSSQVISKSSVSGNRITLTGTAPGYAAPSHVEEEEPIRYGEKDAEKGMRFCVILSVETDGEIAADGSSLVIQNAGSAVLRCCAATSFNGYDKHPFIDGKDEMGCCIHHLIGAEKVSFEEAKKRHIKDYAQYFERMELQVSSEVNGAELPTDERIRAFYQEGTDVGLYELFFHFGRYLLISSSRPGTQPTTLQGIWNDKMRAPWSSNYTININTQMNYWPVEPCGFSDLHEPLFEMIEELGVTGERTAEMIYGAGGFTVHHNTDIWRFSTPVGRKGRGTARYAYWPMAAGWFCRHLYEHYEYSLDKTFLKEKAYPLLRKAAQFYLDVLVENKDGELVFAPSTSPENCYMREGFYGAVSESTAMTQTIIREVFDECLACAEILGESDRWTENVRRKRDRLKDFVIGEDGRILEWNEPVEEPEVQHRHISHLYSLYPGVRINWKDTPELAEACRKSLETRCDVGTGWSLSWKVSTWARLGDGDHALKLFREQLRFVEPEGASENKSFMRGGGVYPNLFDAHPPFQIDGNFGTVAAVAEMYLQSSPEEISLIPGLPQKFGDSVVKGLCARGRVKADLRVAGGKLEEAVLYTDQTQERVLVYKDHREKVLLKAGIPFVYRG